MSFSLSASPLLLTVCVLAAAGLTVWTYWRTVPHLSLPFRLLLGGLRFVTLFLVLFLLFEPILRHLDREERSPVLAVLVDDSQSLALLSDSTSNTSARSTYETVTRQALEGVEGEVAVYRFSNLAQLIGNDAEEWLDSVRFEGQRTDIAQALDFVREDLQDQNLKGILLVSDGQYNNGRNPLYVAERSPVPIHTAVVGDTTARRDIQIRDIITNNIAYLQSEQPVRVNLRAEDFPAQQVTVSLLRNGQVLSTQTVQLPEGSAEIPVDMAYTPVEAGLQRLSVSVSRAPGEATYVNNDAAFSVRVLDRKKRILLVSTAPDPDLAAIRQMLEADADTETQILVQRTAETFYEQPPASFDGFDAIVLVGYPGRAAGEPFLRRIVAAAESGMPLFFILNRQTDVSLLNRHFGNLLPVRVDAVRNGFFEAAFVPTATGGRHPILNVEGASADMWRRLPPLIYSDSRWQANPGAEVLATTEVRGVALEDPLLAVLQRGTNRSAALLGAGTWRWRNVPEDLAVQEDFWPELLSNTLQWLTTREDDRPVRVNPTEEIFAGGETVRFLGQVYDESLNPVDRASVDVQVTAPDGKQYPYRMETLGNGRYALNMGAMPEGTYEYAAIAQQNGATLGTDSGTFAVGSLNVEFRETRANTPLMRQIALRSGGQFYTPGELGSFPSMLRASETFTAEVREEERETSLRNIALFLAILIVLLSVEWLLRKRSGLV